MRLTNNAEYIPLRDQGPLVQPFKVLRKDHPEPPRALKTLAQIVDNDLCHRCGSCVGICPTNVLALDSSDYPVVKNLSACTDCDLCVKVCPGDQFNVAEHTKEKFGYIPDLMDAHGHIENGYLIHATDPDIRERATSGGFVTGFLAFLLEKKIIDGALVVTADDNVIWKAVPKIARSKEELIAAMKSKYSIVGTNAIFSEVMNMEGRYALVALPCQIHGFLKAAQLDRRIKERIVLTIGLLCHASLENEALSDSWEKFVSEAPEAAKQASRFYFRVGKHPGSSLLELADKSKKFLFFPKKKGYHPDMIEMANILYRLYTPKRCITCYDATVELADIAVGDPWMPNPEDDVNFHHGYTYVVSRTIEADALIAQAKDSGHLRVIQINQQAARTSNLAMATEKRYRSFRVIESLRRRGKPVPEYGFTIPMAPLKHRILTEVNLLTHVFCFLPRWRKKVLYLVLSPVGYYLLWLNKQRRKLRTKRRDFVAALRRKYRTQA